MFEIAPAGLCRVKSTIAPTPNGTDGSMKPHYTLPIVITLVVSATTGMGIALARVNQSAPSTPRPQVSSTPTPQSASTLAPVPTPTRTPMVRPSSTPTPVQAQTPKPAPDSPQETPRTPPTEASQRPVVLSDAVKPGSDFHRFREQFRRAVQVRDYAFVSQLFPEAGVAIGFGRPNTADDLDLADPNSEIWAIFEKALALGCDEVGHDEFHPTVDPGSSIWLCANAGKAFLEQYPNPSAEPGIEYEINNAVIVGNRVNVRSLPSPNSKVVGTLSNEAVAIDRQSWERYAYSIPEESWTAMTHPLNGWTPILLSDGQTGFVNNRYVYQPLSPKLLLGEVGGEWQILQIPAGD